MTAQVNRASGCRWDKWPALLSLLGSLLLFVVFLKQNVTGAEKSGNILHGGTDESIRSIGTSRMLILKNSGIIDRCCHNESLRSIAATRALPSDDQTESRGAVDSDNGEEKRDEKNLFQEHFKLFKGKEEDKEGGSRDETEIDWKEACKGYKDSWGDKYYDPCRAISDPGSTSHPKTATTLHGEMAKEDGQPFSIMHLAMIAAGASAVSVFLVCLVCCKLRGERSSQFGHGAVMDGTAKTKAVGYRKDGDTSHGNKEERIPAIDPVVTTSQSEEESISFPNRSHGPIIFGQSSRADLGQSKGGKEIGGGSGVHAYHLSQNLRDILHRAGATPDAQRSPYERDDLYDDGGRSVVDTLAGIDEVERIINNISFAEEESLVAPPSSVGDDETSKTAPPSVIAYDSVLVRSNGGAQGDFEMYSEVGSKTLALASKNAQRCQMTWDDDYSSSTDGGTGMASI